MKTDKEIPIEYVSIRQIWLQNINHCCEAISNRAKPDVSQEGNFQEIGDRTVTHTVKALRYTLIDYGEAIIKTEVENYFNKVIEPQLKKTNSWHNVANLYQKLFEKIIEVLNKYGMLFEKQPEGYSNVVMEGIE